MSNSCLKLAQLKRIFMQINCAHFSNKYLINKKRSCGRNCWKMYIYTLELTRYWNAAVGFRIKIYLFVNVPFHWEHNKSRLCILGLNPLMLKSLPPSYTAINISFWVFVLVIYSSQPLNKSALLHSQHNGRWLGHKLHGEVFNYVYFALPWFVSISHNSD